MSGARSVVIRALRALSAMSAIAFASCDRVPGSANGSPLPAIMNVSPEGATRYLGFAYSPDGTRIAYWTPADSSAAAQLWIADADLSSPVKLSVTSAFGGLLPIWSPDGSRIAVASSDSGVADIVVVTAATGETRRVTRGQGFEGPISWFPDNNRITYYASAAGGTFMGGVVSVESGATTPLAPGEKLPHFGAPSPDGSHVAYFVGDGPRFTIWVADSNGANPRQLTTEGYEVLEQYQEWSPDGKELLYRSARTGTTDLWIVPIDGGKPRQLTRDVRNDFSASWSPDGKWIAFLSDRGRQTDVWMVPSAGGDEIRVTDNPAIEKSPLQWRRGTSSLSFITGTQQSEVWTLNVADGTETRLTPDSLRADFFNISPDGKLLDVVLNRGPGVHELVVMPIAGGAMRSVVTGTGTIVNPWWSPDGSKIVFESDRGGSQDVWVVSAAGGPPRQLVNWPGYEANVVWSGDGSVVYFYSDRDSRLGDIWKVSPNGGEPVRVTNEGGFGGGISSRRGVSDIFAAMVGKREGQFVLTRVSADGTVHAVMDGGRTGLSGPSISPTGDSLAVLMAQADGKLRSMIIPARGAGGRVILNPGDVYGAWSQDGGSMLYEINSGGSTDIGILNLRDGTTRRLTNTPEREEGAELTPDGRTVVFRRVRTMQRISNVDLSGLLKSRF
jgi:Tol biopolymer transport system component